MKSKLLFLSACLVLLQAAMSFGGMITAQSQSNDSIMWSWEVSSTVSTQTKSCVLEYAGGLILDWGDGSIDTLTQSNSGVSISHVYGSVRDFTCKAVGFGISYFKADSKRLKTLDPTNAPGLTYLSCSSNQLSSINVSSNKQLLSFYCSGNDIASLFLDSCKSLQTLTCSDNKLQVLNVAGILSLKKLTCHTNLLTSLLVAPSGSLTYVSCTNCSLQVAALDTLFACLPTLSEVSSSKNLYVLNNPGTNFCTIASANFKKWTPDLIVNSSAFYIPNSTSTIGDSVCFGVFLTNPVPVIAFELDIEFPKGFVLDTLRSCLSKNRVGSHQFTISKISNTSTTYKFLAYSMVSSDVFKGNSGEIVQLYGTMPDSLQEASILLKEAVLVDTTTNMVSVTTGNGILTVESAFLMGDANGDDVVDVTDIVNLIAFIYGRNPTGFVSMAADMDKNGKWNVADVTKMVVVINSSTSILRSLVFDASKSVQNLNLYVDASTTLGNHVFLRSHSLNPNYLELCLTNSDSLQACQVDIQFEQGLAIKEGDRLTLFRQKDHCMNVAKLSENRFRLMMYSLKPDAAFLGDTGVIARIPLLIDDTKVSGEYPVRILSSVVTGIDLKTKVSLNYDCLATIDKSIFEELDLKVWSDAPSNLWIASSGFYSVLVTNLMGEIVYQNNNVLKNSHQLKLPQGMYLVKATTDHGNAQIKKIMVK